MKKFIKRTASRTKIKEAGAYLLLSILFAVLEEVRPES